MCWARSSSPRLAELTSTVDATDAGGGQACSLRARASSNQQSEHSAGKPARRANFDGRLGHAPLTWAVLAACREPTGGRLVPWSKLRLREYFITYQCGCGCCLPHSTDLAPSPSVELFSSSSSSHTLDCSPSQASARDHVGDDVPCYGGTFAPASTAHLCTASLFLAPLSCRLHGVVTN